MGITVGVRLEMGLPTYNELTQHAQTAEKLGFGAVWLRDHVSLEEVTGQLECLELWTCMAALARDTKEVKIGSLVICSPFRNPALMAKMAATLDLVSDGRLIFGIGAGHKEKEFVEYGYRWPTPGERVEMLSETVDILRLMWTEHRPSYEGKHYRIVGALNEPKPVQKPGPPIMFGAIQPRMLRLTAKKGDAWNTTGNLAEYMRLRQQMIENCEAIGRDPASLNHVVTIQMIPAESDAEAKRRLDKVLAERTGQQYLRDRILCAGPDQIAERFHELMKLGVTDFICSFWEFERQQECIELVGSEILPKLGLSASVR